MKRKTRILAAALVMMITASSYGQGLGLGPLAGIEGTFEQLGEQLRSFILIVVVIVALLFGRG